MSDKPYLRVSYSSMNTFESCTRKFELDKLYSHRRVREDAFAADVGTALHAGYQNFLINHDRDSAIWAMLEKYPYALEREQTNDFRSCEATLATLEDMIDSVSLGDYELAQIKRPLNKLELAEYTKLNLENPALTIPDGLVVPAIEVPFEIRFEGIELPPTPKYPDGCGIAFTGYMDAIMRSLMTDQFRTTDIKTHRDRLPDRSAKYKFDAQQVPYGIVVDHVAGQPVEDFEVLYFDCYVDILEPKTKLYAFTKSRADLQEWLVTRVMQFQQMQQFITGGFFPRTSGGCLFYNKPCRYLSPCASRDPAVLDAWFTLGEEPAPEEEWNPWIITTINPFG